MQRSGVLSNPDLQNRKKLYLKKVLIFSEKNYILKILIFWNEALFNLLPQRFAPFEKFFILSQKKAPSALCNPKHKNKKNLP